MSNNIPESGAWTTRIFDQAGGFTYTLSGAAQSLYWTKMPKDNRGQSLVFLQGSIAVGTVTGASAGSGEVRMYLPFRTSTSLPVIDNGGATNAPTWLGNGFSGITGRFWGYLLHTGTVSHRDYVRLLSFPQADLNDNCIVSSSMGFSHCYFTDDDTLQVLP